jgi:hypothetical protein
MRNNLLTISRISLLFVFASMSAFSMDALWGTNDLILAFGPSWLCLLCLLISAISLFALTRDLK